MVVAPQTRNTLVMDSTTQIKKTTCSGKQMAGHIGQCSRGEIKLHAAHANSLQRSGGYKSGRISEGRILYSSARTIGSTYTSFTFPRVSQFDNLDCEIPISFASQLTPPCSLIIFLKSSYVIQTNITKRDFLSTRYVVLLR